MEVLKVTNQDCPDKIGTVSRYGFSQTFWSGVCRDHRGGGAGRAGRYGGTEKKVFLAPPPPPMHFESLSSPTTFKVALQSLVWQA